VLVCFDATVLCGALRKPAGHNFRLLELAADGVVVDAFTTEVAGMEFIRNALEGLCECSTTWRTSMTSSMRFIVVVCDDELFALLAHCLNPCPTYGRQRLLELRERELPVDTFSESARSIVATDRF